MKNIVLLSDGTGNSAGKKNETNVWRLYSALDLKGNQNQLALYSDGVGSREFLLFKILGGAFGWGLKRNVIELYKFLCRNYETNGNEDGSDKIYLFGFSRGAFTIRVLAGLITECGLIDIRNFNVPEQDLHKKALHNYSVYRNRYKRGRFSNLFTCIPGRKTISCNTVNPQPKIEFIGVWDTVDAYGLPVDELTDLCDKFIFPIRFPDRQLNENVLKACHAVSVDDERHTFHPVLWDESGETEGDRIEQVWFPGVHSDVGGGYPRPELSLVSLDWMISKVEATNNGPGLKFIASVREQYLHDSSPHGVQHDSRSGFAAYYRYKPRIIEQLCDNTDAGKRSVRIDNPKIHSSVFERIKGNVVPYAPTGLPETYEIVSTRGNVKNFESSNKKQARVAAMDRALNVIFWRRRLHATFVATTLILVASRFFLEWVPCAPCTSVFCVLDPLFEFVMAILPDFADGWIDALRQNPEWFLAFAAIFFILATLKSSASTKTLTRATAAWSDVKDSKSPPQWSSTITSKLRKGLDSKSRRWFRCVFWLFVFLLGLAVIFLGLERIAFHVRDSAGWLCEPSISKNGLKPNQETTTIKFDAENPCLPTEVALVAGSTYKFEVNADSNWKDGNFAASPDGLKNDPSLTMIGAIPFRRHISRPWFELTGRVGHSGRETFIIGSNACYTAKLNGELFLYVNDAVFGLLPDRYWAWPYFWLAGRNSGKADVTVTQVDQSSACVRLNSCEESCSDKKVTIR